jgi:hypothetical protein
VLEPRVIRVVVSVPETSRYSERNIRSLKSAGCVSACGGFNSQKYRVLNVLMEEFKFTIALSQLISKCKGVFVGPVKGLIGAARMNLEAE